MASDCFPPSASQSSRGRTGPRSLLYRKILVLFLGVAAALGGLRAQEKDNTQRDLALQSAFGNFERIEPQVDDKGHAKFNALMLNEHPVIIDGKRYDGFTFVAKRQEGEDLVWAFKKHANLKEWYIVPEKGTMKGFVDFNPTEKIIYQGLDGAALVTGNTYLIWFRFDDEIAAKIWVAFGFAKARRNADGEVSGRAAYDALFGTPGQ